MNEIKAFNRATYDAGFRKGDLVKFESPVITFTHTLRGGKTSEDLYEVISCDGVMIEIESITNPLDHQMVNCTVIYKLGEESSLQSQVEALKAENARLRGHLQAIVDYAVNPSASSVNAGYMTDAERIGGMWSQAEAALQSAPEVE